MNRRKNILFFVLLFLIALLAGCSNTPSVDDANTSAEQSGGTIQCLENGLTVAFIDVGQGDSIFIKTPSGKTMLVDAGEREASSAVIEAIHSTGTTKLDVIVGTHPHSDHIGGLADVIKEFEVESIYMPKASSTSKTFEYLLNTIENKGLKVNTAKAGVIIPLDDAISIEMVAPTSDSYENLNNYSAVIHLTYKDTSFLLTGDAEKQSENEILSSGAVISSDVLKVGHHGSTTSTSKAFLEAVSPSIAVIQVGANNDYGHPKDAILERLENCKVLRNDLLGTIVITSDGENLYLNTGETIKGQGNKQLLSQEVPKLENKEIVPGELPPIENKEDLPELKSKETLPEELPEPKDKEIVPEEVSEPENKETVDNTQASTDNSSGVTVYVTKSGKKYHVAGCGSLSKSKIPISLEAARAGYGPCSKCNPPR